jgi:hypothetical protein
MCVMEGGKMDTAEIKTKVEKCIKQFGEDFHLASDRHFWYEYDAQFRLMSILSQEIEAGLSPREPWLVHAHYPAQNGQRYDIAIFDVAAARDIVNKDFCFSRWHRRLRDMKTIAVVIEIAFAFVTDGPRLLGNIEWQYRKDITDVLKRLSENKAQLWENKANTHYIIVCCVTKQFTENEEQRKLAKLNSVRNAINWVKTARDSRKEQPNGIKVYWTSDHPDDMPTWIVSQLRDTTD